MPEYSTPTLTPAGTSKLTGMNGSSAGNFLVSDILDIIRSTYGQANGVASLDSSGKLPTAQLPDIADDVLVYASKALLPAQGVEAKIYITTDDNVLYRWDATLGDYVQLSVDLSDYATLDDLAAEESARETADANLNNAITAIDHRVSNLEQAKGSYVVSNYKDGSITPSGKGNWAIVEGLRGVSRVDNNMVSDGTTEVVQDGAYTGWTSSYTVNGTKPITGRKYLCIFKAKVTAHVSVVKMRVTAGTDDVSADFSISSTGYQTFAWIYTGDASYNYNLRIVQLSGSTTVSGDSIYIKDVEMKDLNVYFNTTDLSFLGATDSAKLATIQQKYPWLLEPSAYGTSMVDSVLSGVEAEGANLFNKDDFTLFNGYVSSGGVLSASADGEKTFIFKALPSQAYYLIRKESYGRIASYTVYPTNGAVGTLISTSSATAFTFNSLATTVYLAITFRNNLGNNYTYEQDIEGMYLGYGTSGSFTPWREPSTLMFPTPVTLKSAGSVAEMYYPETGEQTKPLRTITLNGSENWYEYTGAGSGYTGAALNVGETAKSRTDIINNRGFLPQTTPSDSTQRGITTINTQLYVTFSTTEYATWSAFVASLASNPLVATYALATPNPSTFVTPIIDNTLLTEGGGRLSTVQTGTVVDGSFDMGFITL